MKIKNLAAGLCVWVLLGCSSEKAVQLELHAQPSQNLQDYRGQWLLINYWAIWCNPCREEIPELNRLHAADDIEVLAYNFDRAQGDELTRQAKELDIALPLLITDPAPLFHQKMPSALPATMVIDPQGQFRRWLMGPQDETMVRAALAELK